MATAAQIGKARSQIETEISGLKNSIQFWEREIAKLKTQIAETELKIAEWEAALEKHCPNHEVPDSI